MPVGPMACGGIMFTEHMYIAELRRIVRWADSGDISRKPIARAVRELRRRARDIEHAAAFEVAGTPWLLILMVNATPFSGRRY